MCTMNLYSSGDVTILKGMTFTVVSDLNGESPQFTLTCASTGGPATTATWARDSETVSGGMTVLDDPVTAQYTNTLTVTGRLGGLYQCTVSNNKPSEDSASFTVQGKRKQCKRRRMYIPHCNTHGALKRTLPAHSKSARGLVLNQGSGGQLVWRL